jgi:hypothetical protein
MLDEYGSRIIPEIRRFVKLHGIACWWNAVNGRPKHDMVWQKVDGIHTFIWPDEHGGVGQRPMNLAVCHRCWRVWLTDFWLEVIK